jgi:hypothetical protein
MTYKTKPIENEALSESSECDASKEKHPARGCRPGADVAEAGDKR